MGQQRVGINTIIYYAPTIMEATGLEAGVSILATLGVGIVNVIFTVVALLLITGWDASLCSWSGS